MMAWHNIKIQGRAGRAGLSRMRQRAVQMRTKRKQGRAEFGGARQGTIRLGQSRAKKNAMHRKNGREAGQGAVCRSSIMAMQHLKYSALCWKSKATLVTDLPFMRFPFNSALRMSSLILRCFNAASLRDASHTAFTCTYLYVGVSPCIGERRVMG